MIPTQTMIPYRASTVVAQRLCVLVCSDSLNAGMTIPIVLTQPNRRKAALDSFQEFFVGMRIRFRP